MTEEEKMLLGEMYSSKDKELKRFYFRICLMEKLN